MILHFLCATYCFVGIKLSVNLYFIFCEVPLTSATCNQLMFYTCDSLNK
jgi:hypothetical protein